MRPVRLPADPKPKHHFAILLDGEFVGESWAVSPAKAINNWWWKNVKYQDEMTPRDYDPSDFDAVEI